MQELGSQIIYNGIITTNEPGSEAEQSYLTFCVQYDTVFEEKWDFFRLLYFSHI